MHLPVDRARQPDVGRLDLQVVAVNELEVGADDLGHRHVILAGQFPADGEPLGDDPVLCLTASPGSEVDNVDVRAHLGDGQGGGGAG